MRKDCLVEDLLRLVRAYTTYTGEQRSMRNICRKINANEVELLIDVIDQTRQHGVRSERDWHERQYQRRQTRSEATP